MGRYLIPANTKKGTLIFGLFRESDLIIFGIGIGVTFIMLLVFQQQLADTMTAVMCIAPALIATLLVAPVPYYHNVITVLQEAYEFISTNQRLIWKGWCFKDGTDAKK